MKILRLRFSIYCLVVLAVVCLPINSIFLENFCKYQSSIYSFYTDELFEGNGISVVKNGKYYILSVDGTNAEIIKSKLNNVYGESVTIKNYSNKAKEEIFLSLSQKEVSKETLREIEIYYFYDATLPNFVIVGGKKTNIQVAVTAQNLTVGYPLILGSF